MHNLKVSAGFLLDGCDHISSFANDPSKMLRWNLNDK
eukprot:CAMPEP_0194737524 /NCGR_PEP_ID=MMETSP0296-20130528/81391_1 /TAXON_ID=39354 /ORGANISM="Heterosigma akashiwo, Strain CCMP2393" /LENGTH=36 /DNA_ID= /DNA_START= /DNA_END= /DNA_ORIENTATION=